MALDKLPQFLNGSTKSICPIELLWKLELILVKNFEYLLCYSKFHMSKLNKISLLSKVVTKPTL